MVLLISIVGHYAYRIATLTTKNLRYTPMEVSAKNGALNMSGYQFGHVEGYARKGGVKTDAKTKTKSTVMSGWDIVDEAERKEGATPHIEKPQPPILLFGVMPSVAMKEAAEWAEQAKDASGRKLRVDGLCLSAGVISFPAEKEGWPEYRDLTLERLKKKHGDRLRSAVEHTDEAYPHFHYYVVPKVGQRFDSIHEGYRAANEAKAKGLKKGEQNAAFKGAMREWQDDLHATCGVQFGLSRTGPRRQRLTREQWKEQQKANVLLGKNASNAKAMLDPRRIKEIVASVKPTHKAGLMGKGEDLYTLTEVEKILNAAVTYTRNVQYNAKIDFISATAKADAEINAEAASELASLKNQVVELKQTITEKETAFQELQASFDKRGTAISNAVHKVKQLEGQLDNALTLSVEWKTKYQQEHVKANGLERDLSDKVGELRELKREHGLDANFPKNW